MTHDPYAWHSVSDLIETARKHAMPREPGTLGHDGWKPRKMVETTVRAANGELLQRYLHWEQDDAL